MVKRYIYDVMSKMYAMRCDHDHITLFERAEATCENYAETSKSI
jgi:hypothetical protein